MSSNQELAVRNRTKVIEECRNENPHAHKIIDADCEFESGKFKLSCLPCPLPSLFTVRFTAPVDYEAGNVIEVKGKELPVRTPGMIDAASDIFKAGAVIHCDIDLDRELAFFWQGGGNGTAPGVLPDMSYEEQYAGYRYLDGRKVYVKTIQYGRIRDTLVPGYTDSYQKDHGIIGMDKPVEMKVIFPPASPGSYYDFDSFYRNASYTVWSRFCRTQIQFQGCKNYLDYSPIVTLYYTCTDR